MLFKVLRCGLREGVVHEVKMDSVVSDWLAEFRAWGQLQARVRECYVRALTLRVHIGITDSTSSISTDWAILPSIITGAVGA